MEDSEMKYTNLLFVGAFWSFFAVLTLSSVSAKSAIMPIFENQEYNDFFHLLSNEEKIWIMNLAVWYYDADKIEVSPFPIPIQTDGPQHQFGFKPNPLPTNNTSGDIPHRLISQFLNGDVPKHWQKEFTKWLTKTYKLKPQNYEQYKSLGVFCTKGDSCTLIDLTNIGGICCPFG